MKNMVRQKSDLPFNELPLLPPDQIKVETITVLRQVVQSSIALAELKGLVYTLPNPSILLNAVILKEARMSSEIENVITTHDKLYQALSATGTQIDHATKEVLCYREAMLAGFKMITHKGFLNTNGVLAIQEILEDNKAGLRRLPGTSLKNAITGEVIYTPPDDYDKILALMKNLEVYIPSSSNSSIFLFKSANRFKSAINRELIRIIFHPSFKSSLKRLLFSYT